jgi:transposase
MKKQRPKSAEKAKRSARAAAREARKARAKGKVGRPSKFTPERAARIVEALQIGAYRETAAEYGGISTRCFYDWIDLGTKALEDGEDGERPPLNAEALAADPDADPILPPIQTFAQFVQAVKDAEAQTEVRSLSIIQTASTETWQAAAWLLERKFPNRYGRRMQAAVEVGGTTAPGGKPVGVDMNVTGAATGVVILPALKEE